VSAERPNLPDQPTPLVQPGGPPSAGGHQPWRPLVLVRGGGDLGTGVVWRLWRSGLPVIVTELPRPLTVRRTVAVSSAVSDGAITVEQMRAVRVDDSAPAGSTNNLSHHTPAAGAPSSVGDADADTALHLAYSGVVPVLVSADIPRWAPTVGVSVVVDARLAKRNIDTTINDAPLVIGLGPGFVAGQDCHAVVETMRGPRLGRVQWTGSAQPNTGTPGLVAGHGAERVLRAPGHGTIRWAVAIGDRVELGQPLGAVTHSADASQESETLEIRAPFPGLVRGLIAEGTGVKTEMKVGDIDPRFDVDCHTISDKALALGGAVLEAILHRGQGW